MLIDLPDTVFSPELRQRFETIFERPWESPIERVTQGIYLSGLNTKHFFPEGLIVTDYPFDPFWGIRRTDDEEANRAAYAQAHMQQERLEAQGYPNCYGVVDSPEQFLEKFGTALLADPRTFVALFTEMRQDKQPESGGWRWHKWGPYYGTHDRQCEYLYDEVGIERVYCYHVYEVDPTSLVVTP